jgi:hypothetical protein
MAFTNGYKYNTEIEAILAQKACDTYYGIPVHPDDITQHWCGYNFAELNEPKFWYITYDISLVPILGDSIEFEITYPPSPFNETN